MAYLLIAYVIGYLISVTIITLRDKPDNWDKYIGTGLVAFFWPALLILGVLGLIPWLISKAKSAGSNRWRIKKPESADG